MCHVSFNLVGIHRPEADRLPSPPGLKEGGGEERVVGGRRGRSRHHAAHLGIASESSSSCLSCRQCVCAGVCVWMHPTHICATSRILLHQTFAVRLAETPRSERRGLDLPSRVWKPAVLLPSSCSSGLLGSSLMCELLSQSQ